MSVVPAITSMLQEYLVDADLTKLNPQYISKFHCRQLPNIDIPNYVLRLEKYMQVDPEMFVVACMYIERL
jgi:hypothetical protein